jgi:hypothetical protein
MVAGDRRNQPRLSQYAKSPPSIDTIQLAWTWKNRTGSEVTSSDKDSVIRTTRPQGQERLEESVSMGRIVSSGKIALLADVTGVKIRAQISIYCLSMSCVYSA